MNSNPLAKISSSDSLTSGLQRLSSSLSIYNMIQNIRAITMCISTDLESRFMYIIIFQEYDLFIYMKSVRALCLREINGGEKSLILANVSSHVRRTDSLHAHINIDISLAWICLIDDE